MKKSKENKKRKGKTGLLQRSKAKLHSVRRMPLAFSLIVSIMMATAIASGTNNLQTLPVSPSADWITVAVIVVLTVMGIAAIVYALSGIMDTQGPRAWARFQIYEGILSIGLIIVFATFTYLFFMNPSNSLSAIGLVPQNSQTILDCTGTYTMFDLSTCNLAVFTAYTYGFLGVLFYMSLYTGYTPGFGFNFDVPGSATNAEFEVSASMPSLIPISWDTAETMAFSALSVLLLMNQIQLFLVSGAMLWLGLFLTIGLIARTLGFSRSFGGAMIALALGLGFIYPLIVNVTYGFINTQIAATPDNSPGYLGYDMFGSVLSLVTGSSVNNALNGNWVLAIMLVMAGLTFIPFINFTIVDAFIVDFSKAIGERLDFMSMLVGII